VSAQLDLRPDWRALWEPRRLLLRGMVYAIGVKTVAYDLDVAPSQLLNAVEERERNFPARWEDYLLLNAPRAMVDEYLRQLAHAVGLDVIEASPPMSEGDELAAIKAALQEELGTGARAAVMARAQNIHKSRRRR
jgi:hypothetical protein